MTPRDVEALLNERKARIEAVCRRDGTTEFDSGRLHELRYVLALLPSADAPAAGGPGTCATCEAVAKALKAYPDSDVVSLATTCRAASERFDALYDIALPAIERAILGDDGLDGADGERILRDFGYWPAAEPPAVPAPEAPQI